MASARVAPPASLDALLFAGVLVSVGVAVLYLYAKRAAIGAAVNPLAGTNLAYRGAGALTSAITGDTVNSLGTKLAEWFSPSARAA